MSLSITMADPERKLRKAFLLLDDACAERAFPGGVLAVGLRNGLIIHPFGRLSYDKNAPYVNFNTIYDLASLTKPIVTTTAIMMLLSGRKLRLEDRVVKYIPEWQQRSDVDGNPRWRNSVTIQMLLLHTAGFSKRVNSYNKAGGYASALKLVMAEPLINRPGSKIEYSDMGFILLGEIVRRITKRPLDIFARTYIFKPLRMENSTFNPRKDLKSRIAPTEYDRTFRKQLVHGFVHDEKAWAMGGVAGHAGLFSTATDISKFAAMMLNGGKYNKKRLIKNSIIRQFTKRHTINGSSRALGWDVPTKNSTSGSYLSKESFGHTGFTGTSLWIDPKRKIFVILLTNRINPTRNNTRINRIRPELHDSIMKSLSF